MRSDVPHLRIIDDDLWAKVQARKQKTRVHYLRSADGRLLSKPESGLTARHMLSGIARCGVCGGGLAYMGKQVAGARKRYYCLTRNRRGPLACSNGHGVPMEELDHAVLACLYEDLLSDRERLWALIEENDARCRREREAQQVGRVSAEREVARLETEIGRLVSALAAGTVESPDIVAAIAARRSHVAALQARPEPTPVSRAHFLEGYAAFRVLLNRRHPVQVRQVLRKLGVDRITVTPDRNDGWSFEGLADVGYLLNDRLYTGLTASGGGC